MLLRDALATPSSLGVSSAAALGQLRRFTSFTLLLTGIAVNGICMSLVLLLHNLAGVTKSFQITHWLLGGVDAAEYPVLLILALVIVPVFIWLLRLSRVSNVISSCDAWARGVSRDRASRRARFCWAARRPLRVRSSSLA